MARSENKVEKANGYIDTEYSSGDSNKTKCKQLYQEENNNNVDELSKDLSEMGCIVDAVKRPPNICVETCVYEESESEHEDDNYIEVSLNDENDEVHYSDEFEEETNSDGEEVKDQSEQVLSKSNSRVNVDNSSTKLSTKQSLVSTNKPGSISGRSSDYGSISVPPTRRANMSFTNERLREIERHNHILLNKILSVRNSRTSSIPPREQPRKPVPPAAVHRKLQQRKIDHDNMILLKKIQRAKSSACSLRR